MEWLLYRSNQFTDISFYLLTLAALIIHFGSLRGPSVAEHALCAIFVDHTLILNKTYLTVTMPLWAGWLKLRIHLQTFCLRTRCSCN